MPEITIDAVNGTGQPIQGLYVVLEQTSDSNIVTGYTPVTFPVIAGQGYTITATDSGNDYFNHWTNNFTVRVMPVTGTTQDVTYTAVYLGSIQPPPTTTPYTISVVSHDINGTPISGFFVDIRVNGYHITSGPTPINFTNLEPGVKYQVILYWYANYWLREFSDGDLNRYAAVIFNDTGPTSVSYNGLYQYVPPADAAAMNVESEFPNGTIIGTTYNNTSYIEHTPGLWLTVTPPGSNVPFTGTFTGGSILPFILFRGDTYVLSMTTGYDNCLEFQDWQDTGSTNPVRSVDMTGNLTLIAVYAQTGPCPVAITTPATSGVSAQLQVRSVDKVE